ncbi:MAG: hypothetical protein HWE10_13075 [Gammaproteobacteria bacterium]|nr:hypothetical protein [Gammaproteobacteria bacterium]
MKFKLKPLSVAMLAAATALSGCSSDDDNVTKTPLTSTGQTLSNGYVVTADSGLSCKLPDVVQEIDSDFYPLTQAEKDALRAAVDPTNSWDADTVASWNDASSYDAYDYDYDGVDLYAVFASVGADNGHTNEFGLTNEEVARQVTAKAEARTFKGETQKQADILGDGFDAWFDTWFATVPYTDYLGNSQRLNRARRGLELSLSSANDDQEVCYTPPASCPNFQVVDETGTFSCVTPEVNPLAADQPNMGVPEEGVAPANSTRIYYKDKDHSASDTDVASSAVYKDLIIHAWNDPDCTAYDEESVTGWDKGPRASGIDPNYGAYWDLGLADAPDQCGNIIIYNVVDGDQGKKISSSDLRIPLGNSGSLYVNTDKTSYFQEGVNAINYDGFLFANQHPLVGASSGAKSCGWGTELNDSGDACIGQELPDAPTGTVAVGEGQTDIASKYVTVFDPDEEGLELFVRGAFHTADWSADDANKMQYFGNGQFLLNYEYGDHEDEAAEGAVSAGYKIADSEWTEHTNFGGIAGNDAPEVNGGSVDLTVGEGVAQNITTGFEENTIYQFNFDASNPEETTFKLSSIPVNVYPVVYMGDYEIVLPYEGENKYSASRVELAAGTYTVALSDPHSDFAVGADTETVVTAEGITLVANGTEMTYTVDSDGEYDFVLDLTDQDAPVFSARSNIPFGTTPTYIRGGMNDWGNSGLSDSELLDYNSSTRTYSVLYGLEAGTGFAFKFADADWGPVNLGYADVTISDDDDAIAVTESSGNMRVVPSESTVYGFQISFAESATGEVKVAPAGVYIRGGIYGTGDWAADDTMRLHFDPVADGSAGQVLTGTLTTTGTGSFKIADEGWGGTYGVNYGTSSSGENQVVLGTPIQLIRDNDPLAAEADREAAGNIGFQHPAGTYKFVFDLATKQLIVTAE